MKPVRYEDSAREEFFAALESYVAISRALGADFLDEVEAALARISVFPEHGSPYLFGSRRVVLRGFPFQLIYLVESEVAIIVAFAHQHQEPGYLSDRLGTGA